MSASTAWPTERLHLSLPLRAARAAFEREYFAFQLKRHNGCITAVARSSGIQPVSVRRALARLGFSLTKATTA